MITVYTKPGCGTCDATKIWLKRNKIAFDEIDVSVDVTGREILREMGYTQMPVVVADTEAWSGFRVEKLAGLKTFHPSSNSDVIGE